MRRPLAILCCALMALAGCDDPQISGPSRRITLLEADLPRMANLSQILVEVHGVPWAGATPGEVTESMKMPQGPARRLRFVLAPVGESRIGARDRLVLHFNPLGEPNSEADCRARGPLPSAEPSTRGFKVNVTLCRGNEWMIRAFMKSGADANDWLAYHLAMGTVLGKMFPD